MEQVLVVERNKLLDGQDIPYGFHNDNIDVLLRNIHKFAYFIGRSDAENNQNLKQIIPYLVITGREGTIFLVQRLAGQTEKRLHNKYSIGIGGHINPVVSPEGKEVTAIPDIIKSGLERELHEELQVTTPYQYRLSGYLNDDSNSVGQVHLGLVHQVLAEDTRGVSVLENDLMVGNFAAVSEIEKQFELLETWSQIVFREFIKKAN
jgi:predicted NUDIX family phosphoesterase